MRMRETGYLSRYRATPLAMARKYQIQATPTIVVLDPAGNTAGVLTGVPPEAELSALIDKAGAS